MIILSIYDFSSSYKDATDDYWHIYYHKPWCRIGPYMVGLLSALLLYSFKNETRQESVFKRFADRIDKSFVMSFVFYTLGLGIMIFLIFSFYWINNYPDDYSLVFNVFYLTFSKTIFILGLNMFLMPLLMGHGKFW